MLYFPVSFLFLFLLVFVLLIEGKGPRCSDGEFDSCAIYAHVTLLREGACTADDWNKDNRHKIHAAARLHYQRVPLKLGRGIMHAI